MFEVDVLRVLDIEIDFLEGDFDVLVGFGD